MAKHRLPTQSEYTRPVDMKIATPNVPKDVKSEFLTRDDEIGLGRRAVRGSMLDTEVELNDYGSNSVYSSHYYRYLLPGHIKEIRESVGRLDGRGADYINRKLAGTYIKNALFNYEVDPNLSDFSRNELGSRLVEKNRDGKYVIDDTTVVNFAEWYMSHTLQRQEELDKQVGALRQRFKDRVQYAIAEWGLPRAASWQLRHIDSVDILEDDMFVMQRNENAKGLYWFTSDTKPRARIMLSPLDQGEIREHTVTHELSHSLSDDPEAEHNRGMLFVELFGDKGGEVLNEALTEHLTVSLLHGDFDTIQPSDRKDNGYYELYRQLLDMFANGGEVKIDIREFYDALYFTQQESMRQFAEGAKVQSLLKKLDEAFPGVNIYQRIINLQTNFGIQNLLSDLRYSRELKRFKVESTDEQLVAAAKNWGNEFDEN